MLWIRGKWNCAQLSAAVIVLLILTKLNCHRTAWLGLIRLLLLPLTVQWTKWNKSTESWHVHFISPTVFYFASCVIGVSACAGVGQSEPDCDRPFLSLVCFFLFFLLYSSKTHTEDQCVTLARATVSDRPQLQFGFVQLKKHLPCSSIDIMCFKKHTLVLKSTSKSSYYHHDCQSASTCSPWGHHQISW